MKFERISTDPLVMTGKPCIKGTRITVELILERLGEGASIDWILEGYPQIVKDDILQALQYAKAVVSLQEIEEAIA